MESENYNIWKMTKGVTSNSKIGNDTSIEHALESRLIGSNVFQSSDSLLDQLLSIHHRAHYHVHVSEKTKNSALKSLLVELSKVEAIPKGLHMDIADNIQGVIYSEIGDKKTASSYVSKELVGTESQYKRFYKMLELERMFYNGNIHVDKFSPKDMSVPHLTDGLTWYYLLAIVKELDLSHLKATSPFHWLLLTVSGHASDTDLFSYGQSLLKSCDFPSADKSNNPELEQFHIVLQQYFLQNSSNAKNEWEQFIIDSIEKTFQSTAVAKTAMLFYQKRDMKRSVLNFTNLVNYSNKHYELNMKYPDLIDLVSSYQVILSTCKKDYEPFYIHSTVASDFLHLLQRLHEKYNIPIVEKEKVIEGASETLKLCLAIPIANVISYSWETLYETNKNNLSTLLNNDQLYFLTNALQTSFNTSVSLKFKFAYHLAMLRQVDQCITYLKKNILPYYPEHFASWHLLALCESCINEDLQVSFKIINSVIQSMCDLYDEGREFTVGEKWQFINIKITQIQLVRDMFALQDALEILPEVFELYNQLFSDEKRSLGVEYNQSNEYLLQMIWLFALELYLENNDTENVNAALKEFKNVTTKFVNLNQNIAHGFVLITNGQSDKALHEFEKVLHFDSTSIEALLGLAKVVFPEENLGVDMELKQNPALLENQGLDSPSSTSLQTSSAVARLKFLFEQLVDRSIEGYQTPAVWWYLSKVYEVYNDSARQQDALWQCIKFEELLPVRDFKYCNF